MKKKTEIPGRSILQNFYAGTSGILLPVPNKEFFPEDFKDKSRLTYYASLFNSLEVNSSFYKVPMAVTVEKWAESVPEDFKFTFKLWRDITHNKDLAFDPSAVAQFMQTIERAGDKKGALLVQFPPGTRVSARPQLQQLLELIRKYDPSNSWQVALEFRHPSWYQEEIYELIENQQMAVVLHDKPGSASPLTTQVQDFVYLRFHGPEGDYKGGYAEDFLQEYAGYIKEWQEERKTVYTYFNNTIGDALQNLQTLNSLLNEITLFSDH